MSSSPTKTSVRVCLSILVLCLISMAFLPSAAEAFASVHTTDIWFHLDWTPSGMVYTFTSFHDLQIYRYSIFEALFPTQLGGSLYRNDPVTGIKDVCSAAGLLWESVFQCTNRVVAPCMYAEARWQAVGLGVVSPPPGLLMLTSFLPGSSGPVYANCIPDLGEICIPAPNNPDECGGSPIVLDLEGDSFAFTGLDDPVHFDIDDDDEAEAVGWTARKGDDGLLAWDRDGDGRITSGAELFGDATPLSNGERAPNGYLALVELDSSAEGGNQNGRIDRGDRRFRSLRIWLDANHDGISQRHELKKLKKHGVRWISLDYFESTLVDEHGNRLLFASPAKVGEGAEARRVYSTDVFFVVDG